MHASKNLLHAWLDNTHEILAASGLSALSQFLAFVVGEAMKLKKDGIPVTNNRMFGSFRYSMESLESGFWPDKYEDGTPHPKAQQL